MEHDATGRLDIATHTVRGCQLRDKNGELIGTVEDVIFEEWTDEPRWLVVHPPGFRHAILHDDRYLPADHAHFEGDEIVTDFGRDEVLHAPIAEPRRHIVDDRMEERLTEHYHLTT